MQNNSQNTTKNTLLKIISSLIMGFCFWCGVFVTYFFGDIAMHRYSDYVWEREINDKNSRYYLEQKYKDALEKDYIEHHGALKVAQYKVLPRRGLLLEVSLLNNSERVRFDWAEINLTVYAGNTVIRKCQKSYREHEPQSTRIVRVDCPASSGKDLSGANLPDNVSYEWTVKAFKDEFWLGNDGKIRHDAYRLSRVR